MVARVKTVAFHGTHVQDVDVEVQITNGLPAFQIVGLPDKAVAESRERVRSALHAMGIALPPKRVTVNLAPADLIKEGSHFDLPIALGLLTAMNVVPQDQINGALVLGELSLDAGLRDVAGVLPAALHASANDNKLICPAGCGREAVWAGDDLDIIAPRDLLQFINHIKGTQVLSRPVQQDIDGADGTAVSAGPDLSMVKGQETAKRALEIAAAGGHNLLMSGPPGSGKSMLASCLPGILPPLAPKEALAVSMIHSLSGMLPEGGLMTQRPYRAPHHSASLPALVGGGQKAKPGEISLAQHGVLFLDELPEFNRSTLEALRQPLETGEVVVARANHHVTYPACFQLIAAMNPCRCGYLGDAERECTKAPRCGLDYKAKLSGPLLDRIDIHIDVPAVSFDDLTRTGDVAESSADVRNRVIRARALQEERYKDIAAKMPEVTNAKLSAEYLEQKIVLADDARVLMHNAASHNKLSARGYHRLLRVARTIADIDGAAGDVRKEHVAESLSYRGLI